MDTYIFVQLWNSFPEELKTTKQKIIHTNITEDLFLKKKIYIKVFTVTESTENVYHVTWQNLYFAQDLQNLYFYHALCIKKLKMAGKEWTDKSENDLLWTWLLWSKTF